MKLKAVSTEKEKIDPVKTFKSYLDSIEEDIELQGAVVFDDSMLDINTAYLHLPHDITEEPSQELGKYLNAFTQQKMYHRTLLGRTELCLEEARRKYNEVSNPVYMAFSKEKMTETAKERIINSDESVKEAYYEYMDFKKKYSILEISIANIEDAIFLISREVTRRVGDFNDETLNPQRRAK